MRLEGRYCILSLLRFPEVLAISSIEISVTVLIRKYQSLCLSTKTVWVRDVTTVVTIEPFTRFANGQWASLGLQPFKEEAHKQTHRVWEIHTWRKVDSRTSPVTAHQSLIWYLPPIYSMDLLDVKWHHSPRSVLAPPTPQQPHSPHYAMCISGVCVVHHVFGCPANEFHNCAKYRAEGDPSVSEFKSQMV
jgi:hypothetical protein